MSVFCILLAAAVCSSGNTLAAEDFSSLDREIEGLFDSWALLADENDPAPAGRFGAGTALLRARAVYRTVAMKDTGSLPPGVLESWTGYLKASAGCIYCYGIALEDLNGEAAEMMLLLAFADWESAGEAFLHTIQDTR